MHILYNKFFLKWIKMCKWEKVIKYALIMHNLKQMFIFRIIFVLQQCKLYMSFLMFFMQFLHWKFIQNMKTYHIKSKLLNTQCLSQCFKTYESVWHFEKTANKSATTKNSFWKSFSVMSDSIWKDLKCT